MSATLVKAGDLVYAVGPGHHAPHGPTDLYVYRTVVKNVRPEGGATYAIELNDDRPVLGFPKWTYQNHEVGRNIHLSAADALRTFVERALGP